jgi:predicted outer membrane protein
LLRAEARILLSQAKSLVDEHQAKVEEGKSVADEIRRRQAAMKVMGFDSLYTAAWLEAHGPSPVESPLVLERREAPSTLAIAEGYR